MTMDKSDSITPPHHPTYDVNLTDDTINAIVRYCIPASLGSVSISKIPHGQSFNNRIYMVDTDCEQHVLKVNGRFFGSAKIVNEVACLLLLKHFCPDVQVPRVVAWSANGSRITRVSASAAPEAVTELDRHVVLSADVPGWILMSRLPGEPLRPEGLSDIDQSRIAKQLAEIVALWRQAVVKSTRAGNVHLQPFVADDLRYSPDVGIPLDLYVFGLQGMGDGEAPPMDSLKSFWLAKIRALIRELCNKAPFEANRRVLVPLLQRFMNNTLNLLSVFHEHAHLFSFTFTHTDLCPRNILVSGSPPRISGIVDFEFAGFFPPLDEFLPEYVEYQREGEGAWPDKMYSEFQQHLEDAGEMTLLTARYMPFWDEITCMSTLQTYIAPWWLAEVGVNGQALEGELHRARQEVETAVWRLEQGTSLRRSSS